MAALTFAPVIIRSVKVNFETVLPAAQQVAFPKRNSAAAPPLLPSHHLIFRRGENEVLHALLPSG